MTHAQKFYQLLEQKGWTMVELARQADVNREQVRRMSLKTPKAVASAIQIAHKLGVSVDWLFDDGRDEDYEPQKPTTKHDGNVDLDLLRQELRKLIGLQ